MPIFIDSGASSARPMAISATPLKYVQRRGPPGRNAGTIASSDLGAMKWAMPAMSSIAARARVAKVMGRA